MRYVYSNQAITETNADEPTNSNDAISLAKEIANEELSQVALSKQKQIFISRKS